MAVSIKFPIPKPDRLPLKISPCPIVEAVVEIRFVSAEPWRNLPGLFHPRIRDRYPELKELPLASMPDELRSRDPAFTWLPLLQYKGAEFTIQFGPTATPDGAISRMSWYGFLSDCGSLALFRKSSGSGCAMWISLKTMCGRN